MGDAADGDDRQARGRRAPADGRSGARTAPGLVRGRKTLPMAT
jgi:hypothetical protein